MMKFTYDDGELDVFECQDDDVGMLNYCHSMAGHTLMIDARFVLVPTELCNTFLIKRRDGVIGETEAHSDIPAVKEGSTPSNPVDPFMLSDPLLDNTVVARFVCPSCSRQCVWYSKVFQDCNLCTKRVVGKTYRSDNRGVSNGF